MYCQISPYVIHPPGYESLQLRTFAALEVSEKMIPEAKIFFSYNVYML